MVQEWAGAGVGGRARLRGDNSPSRARVSGGSLAMKPLLGALLLGALCDGLWASGQDPCTESEGTTAKTTMTRYLDFSFWYDSDHPPQGVQIALTGGSLRGAGFNFTRYERKDSKYLIRTSTSTSKHRLSPSSGWKNWSLSTGGRKGVRLVDIDRKITLPVSIPKGGIDICYEVELKSTAELLWRLCPKASPLCAVATWPETTSGTPQLPAFVDRTTDGLSTTTTGSPPSQSTTFESSTSSPTSQSPTYETPTTSPKSPILKSLTTTSASQSPTSETPTTTSQSPTSETAQISSKSPILKSPTTTATSQSPTSGHPTTTSASQSPTSAHPTATSASQSPTSGHPTTTSASQSPTPEPSVPPLIPAKTTTSTTTTTPATPLSALQQGSGSPSPRLKAASGLIVFFAHLIIFLIYSVFSRLI
ncbi:uncharacterized protein [Penaeus vannamei]|uniref:uncharacterized protein isoform X2 n=1 Tax=Penaeus vannamei TaxID=6689 RepID=UPI00387F8599